MRTATKIFLIFYLVFTGGCSEAFKSTPSDQIQPNITLPEMSITEEGYLTIAKSGLEKEYLLQTSFIDTSGLELTAPAFHGTHSRIIYFKKQNKSLFMMESNKGLLTSEETPAEWILTEFKIIEEDENKIVFDFNEGMKNIFVGIDLYSSDAMSGRPPTIAIRAPYSFLKEVKNENNKILIRQVAQLQITSTNSLLKPVEVLYYLQNYNPEPDFKPIQSPGFERVGFFEAHPFVRPEFGDFQTYITRWNLKKPIVFSISDNTPQEFIGPIQEGVLYWNKAFGVEIVRAEMAPAGIRAPHPDYNIIQWVTYHYASFAYADFQMDPRTGEILHAQIFLTTAHVVNPLIKLDEMERTTEENSASPQNLLIGLKGFTPGRLCEYSREDALESLRSFEIKEKTTALKMAQDFLRNTTAHEVGHTLGLRHNFAASTGSELTPKEISELFDAYLQTGDVTMPGRVASSVMDYHSFQERILNGKYIAEADKKPLPYDAMAIDWAYFGTEPNRPLQETLYCPETLAGAYDDCLPSDGSSHPLLAVLEDFNQGIETLPQLIAKIFLLAKTHFDPEKRQAVGNVVLPPTGFAQELIFPLQRAFGLMKEEARSLLVERRLFSITEVNLPQAYLATTRWLDQAISEGGGIQNLMYLIDEHSLYEKLSLAYSQFVSIIENQSFRSGQTSFGESYEFTDREINVMKRNTKPFFEIVASKVLQDVTAILAGEGQAPPIPLPSGSLRVGRPSQFRPLARLQDLETTLANWAEFIITDHAEAVPTFDGELRLLATDILLPDQGPSESWQEENRQRVLEILLENLAQRYGRPFETIQPDNLSEEDRRLYEVEAMIIQILSGEAVLESAPAS